MKGDLPQILKPVSKRAFQVLVPEKLGIRQARPDHTLVAFAHGVQTAAVKVAEGNEMRQQLPALRADRKIFLVGLHGGDEHLGRQVQEARLKAAEDRHGPLDQRGDFIQEVGVDHGLPLDGQGRGFGQLLDLLLAPGKIDQHPPLMLENTRIFSGRIQRQLGCPMKSVPPGHTATLNSKDFGLNHLRSHHQHDPMDRADKFSRPVAPTHALGNRQAGEGLTHDIGNQIPAHDALLDLAHRDPGPLVGFKGHQVLDRSLCPLEEALKGLARRSIGVEGRCLGRTPALDRQVRLADFDPLDQKGEPAWRCIGTNGIETDRRLVQPGLDLA